MWKVEVREVDPDRPEVQQVIFALSQDNRMELIDTPESLKEAVTALNIATMGARLQFERYAKEGKAKS